jgi:ribosome production factor 2
MKKSGTRVPLVELKEIGPAIDFIWRRNQFGASDLRKEALMTPKILTIGKQKNVTRNKFQDKMGRVHVNSQQIGIIHNNVRKPKALRKRKSILYEDETQPFIPSKRRNTK